MTALPWFRFYSEAVRDPKLRRTARETGESPAHVLGVWCILLAFANDSPERGKLLLADGIPVTEEDISDVAGCNVSETLLKLSCNGLVTFDGTTMSIPAWKKRQFGSDSSTPRVQKHRLKGKKQPETPSTGTLRKRSRNVSETAQIQIQIQNKEEEKEEEISAAKPPSSSSSSPLPVGENGSRDTSGLSKNDPSPAAAPEYETTSAGRRYEEKMKTYNGQVPEVTRVPLVSRLAEFYGLTALIDAGEEAHLFALHEEAIKLYRIGCHTPAELDAVIRAWWEVWPGSEGSLPTGNQFSKFVSLQVGKKSGKNSTPKQQKLIAFEGHKE